MKKIPSIVMAFVLTLSLLGCGSVVKDGIDKNRTQLYVAVFNGGFGSQWLKDLGVAYETLHPEIQVVVDDTKKDELNTDNLKNSASTYGTDVYMGVPVNYLAMIRAGNLAADITDIVTGNITYGESYTDTPIATRMDAQMKSFYNNGTADAPQYYAVPVGGSPWGLNYDVDLFEEEELYIASSDGTGTNIVWTSGKTGSAAKSVGLDGEAGSYDDGTPTTFEDFKELILRMAEKNITPFMWCQDYSSYRYFMLMSMWADYEGAETFNGALSMDGGTYEIYDDTKSTFEEAMASDGKKATIDADNGYYISKMKGKGAAIEFAEFIGQGEYFDRRVNLPSTTFLTAQQYYVSSINDPQHSRCAFIIDGGYWYSEIRAYDEDFTAKRLSTKYPNGRRYSIMPFPKFSTSKNTQKSTFLMENAIGAFVYKNTPRLSLAKDFLQFCFSTENIKKQVASTGRHMFYDYTLSEQESNGLPYYYRMVEEALASEHTETVIDLYKTDFYRWNEGYQTKQNLLWGGSFSNNGTAAGLVNPIFEFKSYASLNKHLYMTTNTFTPQSWRNQFKTHA